MGWIYFAGAEGARGPVKIGWTSNPADRLKSIQNGCPHEIKMLAVTPGSIGGERRIHAHFAARRIRPNGEWFERSNEMMAVIAQIRGESWQVVPFELAWLFDGPLEIEESLAFVEEEA